VLSETDTLRVDADVRKEAMRAPDKLSNGGVAHNTLVQSTLQGGLRLVSTIGYERKFELTKLTKVVVDRRLGVDEILQFSHVEFSQTNHALARGDFVPVAFADLDCTEREPFPEVTEQGIERGKHALSCFRS